MSPDSIPANLSRIRLAAGLTPTALAKAIGVSRQFVNRIESGEKVPSVARLCDLCAALGCDPADLLGGGA